MPQLNSGFNSGPSSVDEKELAEVPVK
jgi:hypothetical protein